jgi:hypothetical protein
MFRQHLLQRAEALLLMRLARTVFQPRALHLYIPKQRAHGDVVMSLAVASTAAVRTASALRHVIVDLFLHHHFLDPLQYQLAFRQGEAQGFHLHSRPFQASHFLHLLVSGIVHYHQLKSELHAPPSSLATN